VDDRERLIERIEQADDRFLRLTAGTRSSPLQSTDLTMQQLKTLLILSHEDGPSGQALAQALGVGLPAVSGIAKRLAARGLVRRVEDPHDRRIRRVHLTDEGAELIRRTRDAGRDSKRRLLKRLDRHALSQMAEAMDALNAAAANDIG
jgi:DNA-binding MarR family transcriptional regulator